MGVHSDFGEAPEKWDLISSQTLDSCSLWQRATGISPVWLHGRTQDVFPPAILLSGKGQPFSLQGQPRKRACFPDMWYSFAWNFWHHLLQSGAAASSQALGFGVGLNGKGGIPSFFLESYNKHSAFPGFNRSCSIMAGLYCFRKATSLCWGPREGVGGAGDWLHLGFAGVLRVIYGSRAAPSVTAVLSAQMLGLGVGSTGGVCKGDSQLSVSQLQQTQSLEEQVLVSCLLL